jgi:hypothetical protein
MLGELGVEVPAAGIPASCVSEYHHPQRVESKKYIGNIKNKNNFFLFL